jgi:hypothetical protein
MRASPRPQQQHTEQLRTEELPSWAVGVCGVAAVASVLFSILLFLNR